MTKCALTDVYTLHQQSQMPAIHCDPCTEVRRIQEGWEWGSRVGWVGNGVRGLGDLGRRLVVLYTCF